MEGILQFIAGILLGFGLGALSCFNLGTASREGQAIERGYASYRNGNFIWKDDLERRLYLEDLEFFKRHENLFKKEMKMPTVEEFN